VVKYLYGSYVMSFLPHNHHCQALKETQNINCDPCLVSSCLLLPLPSVGRYIAASECLILISTSVPLDFLSWR